ncbi:hypothetical protein WCX49_06700 [Sulfurimonas sp. HSL-1656]|uniref:hypothetical protein n=1 Tax=Thiomicrolovo subterrani TaxID=3131934 RepID=UPI0031F7E926
MKPYIIIPKSITNGLKDVEIGTAGGYLVVLDAPALANITVKLNDQNNDPIPLEKFQGIEAKGVTKVFVSADAVAGGIIKLAQAKTAEDFRILTQISQVDINSLGGYDQNALDQLTAAFSASLPAVLDKVVDKYDLPQNHRASTNAGTLTILFDFYADCDKMTVRMFCYNTSPDTLYWGNVVAYYDSEIVANASVKTFTDQPYIEFTIENCRGKHLVISGISGNGTFTKVGCMLSLYTLKA